MILIIYISFIYVDSFNIKTKASMNILKYLSIVLCFLITLVWSKNSINKEDLKLLQMGMFFTLIADLFLVILDYHIAGVMTFSIVQMVYIRRYTEGKAYKIIKRLIEVFILISISYFLINRYLIKFEFLIALGLFYSICILISILKSIEASKKGIYPNLNKHMIVWGMILFALCDLNVGLSRIESIHNISSKLIWIFYLPSQVLLSLSGYKYEQI